MEDKMKKQKQKMSNFKSYVLIFIWVLLRIVNQETISQIALRNYCKEAEEEDREEGMFQARMWFFSLNAMGKVEWRCQGLEGGGNGEVMVKGIKALVL